MAEGDAVGQKRKLKPGDIINGTYEAVRVLGAGYSGEVWEVRQRYLGASFALKLMHAEDGDNEHKTSRFSAEASTLFSLQHENVVRVVDANQTPEGLSFTVMELLSGETLGKLLAKGRIHPLRALKYAYDVACGLDAAHEIGVIHRDVKPDNVFITLDGIAKLLDFTAAKFLTCDLRTTQPPDRVGTLAFMSPDHLAGATSDARIDQYSLALLVWNMIAGRHPFEHHFGAQYQLMKAQYEETPLPLAQVVGLPAWMDELLAPALAKVPARRYATMAELARRIHEAMLRLADEIGAGRVLVNVPLGEPPFDLEAAPPPRSRRRTYVGPEEIARQTTGPVLPSRRVTLAPQALTETQPEPESDEDARFDAAATVPVASFRPPPFVPVLTTTPMPAPAQPLTAPAPPIPAPAPPITAPVQPMTTSVQPRSRSRAWVAPLLLVLAIPVVGALAWRWKMGPIATELPAQAAPMAPVVASASPAPTPAAAPMAPTVATSPASEPAPAPAPGPPKPRPWPAAPRRAPTVAPPSATEAPMAAPPATALPALPAEAPPAPPPAPHRLFETEK